MIVLIIIMNNIFIINTKEKLEFWFCYILIFQKVICNIFVWGRGVVYLINNSINKMVHLGLLAYT